MKCNIINKKEEDKFEFGGEITGRRSLSLPRGKVGFANSFAKVGLGVTTLKNMIN